MSFRLALRGRELGVHRPVPVEFVLNRSFRASDLRELRLSIAALAGQLGFDRTRIENLLVVVTELATNAVRHAGGSGIVRLWANGGRLHCQVADEGPGIADPHRAGVTLAATTSDEGRGLWLVRQLSDHVEVAVDDRGTVITTAFDLPHDGPADGG